MLKGIFFLLYTPFTRAKLKTLITQNADEKVETSNAADTLEDNLANLAGFFFFYRLSKLLLV